jgi:hypothetical protein
LDTRDNTVILRLSHEANLTKSAQRCAIATPQTSTKAELSARPGHKALWAANFGWNTDR